MEKKINRVQRWLERCLKACKSKSWENALADMECAAAELESARRELWSVVDGSRTRRKNGRYSKTLGASIAAAIFVLMAALPVTMPEPVRQVVSSMTWEDERELLELVTRDERQLLMSLRKSLSSANSGLADLGDPVEKASSEETVSGERYAAMPSEKRGQPERVSERVKDESASVRLDEMMQLIEIGQKALRSDGGLIVLEER